MRKIRSAPFISITLVSLNVLLFMICTFTGDLLYNIGGFGVLYLYQGEYYRLITSMFLHADITHLVNNMILLMGLGAMIEKETGHIRFLIFYFVSGLCGSALSAALEVVTDSFTYSIGASGAVFGMVGVLLAMVLLSKRNMANVTVGRVIIMIAYSLYSGFRTENINNEAHIGGLIGGFILAAIWCLWQRRGEKAG